MEFRRAVLRMSGSEGIKTYELVPDRANSFAELYVDFQFREEAGGRRFTVFLHPKETITVLELALDFNCPTSELDAGFFANGYQSWSESRLYAATERQEGLRRIARPFIGHSGDDMITGLPRGSGYLHSWTYTYLLSTSGKPCLLGSLNEHTGFTRIVYDAQNQLIVVKKDLEGLEIPHSFPGLDLWIGQGPLNDQADRYFHLLHDGAEKRPLPGAAASPLLNWTSWYRYYTDISEEKIRCNTEAIVESGLPFRFIQIDDGWQTAVGDWRSVKRVFPGGMGSLAAEIRNRGLSPGLWLAPFVASGKSELVRRNPDWLLKNNAGKPVRAGWNPYWGGWFYALDLYHQPVQDYLSGVFHIMLDHWGYDMLKLDFLYAACLFPPKGKTRGQVMADAMGFLRRQMGDRIMLACGVPLGAAMGHADICRTGGDVHLAWEHGMLAWLRHRERVSTLAALRSTLGRWLLHNRAFCSDPDVFILRTDQQRLSPVQQHTLLTINALLGGILFTSDDVSAYTPEQRCELEAALDLAGSRVTSVSVLLPDVYSIRFEQEDQAFRVYCNLNKKPVVLEHTKNGRIEIQPFETIILKA
ncbi:MAG: alpha-galactosidase [Bacteroidetes bacterium]|nr:MAG: alpha-galactosidase [Bacteroidota bacterium]